MRLKRWAFRRPTKPSRRYLGKPVTREQLRHSDYELYGETMLSRLSEAVEDDAWFSKILSLTWTAGPVTAVALYFSYWLAYGKPPATTLLLYFGTFGLATGLISLASSLFYKITIAKNQDKAERMLLNVITSLPELILAVRNENIARLSSEEKRFYAGAYLLEDPDASESSLIAAIEILTENSPMARKAAEFETYRKKGLFSLIDEHKTEALSTYWHEIEKLKKVDRYVATLVARRLEGRPPAKSVGKVRERGFLSHIIAAQVCQNLRLIRLKDTEELLILIMELLLGRSYRVLRWKLAGSHPLIEMARRRDRFQQRHKRFIQRRIRMTEELVELLATYLDVSDIHLDSDEDQLTETSLFQLRTKTQELEHLQEISERDRKLVVEQSQRKIDEIVRVMRALQTSSERMRALKDEFYQVRRRYGQELPFSFVKSRFSSGVYFESSTIRLTSEQKLELAEDLSALFEPFSTNPTHTQVLLEKDDYGHPKALSPYMIASLTNDIFAALSKHIDLHDVMVRESLEASYSIYITPIEWGLSKRTKFGWLTASVEEIEMRPGPVALKTVQRLLKYFSGELGSQHLHFLNNEFRLKLKHKQAQRMTRLIPPPPPTKRTAIGQTETAAKPNRPAKAQIR